MTSNGRGEAPGAALINQGLHRQFRHKNANHLPPPKQSDSPPPRPLPSATSSTASTGTEDDWMAILEGFMDGHTGASRHRRQMSAAYRGVEYALSPTLKSPPIVFPRNPSPLSPQYYQRPTYQPQTPIHDAVQIQSPSPLYNRTQAFRYSQHKKHKPAPLRLQADSPTLGHWGLQQAQASPIHTPYLLDDHSHIDDGDDGDDEFPIRPSAAPLPYKEHDTKDAPPAPRKRLTDLLQDVLEIMTSITSQQSQLEEEGLALQDMVELVVTMQEQADSLMEYSDLVEEYVDVVNDEATLFASPSSAYSTDDFDVGGEMEDDGDGAEADSGARALASRADSGVSVGDDIEDTQMDGGQLPKTGAGIMPAMLGRARKSSRGKQFRDSGLGLSSPDLASRAGTIGRGKGPGGPATGRNGRPYGARGDASGPRGR